MGKGIKSTSKNLIRQKILKMRCMCVLILECQYNTIQTQYKKPAKEIQKFLTSFNVKYTKLKMYITY